MEERKNTPTIADLMAAIARLEEKVEACNGLCEAVLDEVVPIGLALDTMTAESVGATCD